MERLIWLEATTGDARYERLWSFLRSRLEEQAAGRFATELRHVPRASGGVRNRATRLMSDAVLLSSAVGNAPDADAMVLGCWGSPIDAVRAAVGIPVTSLPEASLHIAGSFARRVAVITVAPALEDVFAEDAVAAGQSGRLLIGRPVRAYVPESTLEEVVQAIDDPAVLVDRFEAAAVRAVDDGADAIIAGCGYVGPILAAHGYTAVASRPDVPVYDCNAIALEYAAMLLRLNSRGVAPGPSYAAPDPRVSADFHGAVAAMQRQGVAG